MQIYFINQISKYSIVNQQKRQNNYQKKYTTSSISFSNNIKENYNQTIVSFQSKKVSLNNFDKWIKQNNICERTMKSYERLLVAQKNRTRLMNKLEGLVPKITSTYHVINHRCTDIKGNPIEYVIQSVSLLKDNKPKGHYDVQYDRTGELIDTYLVFGN